VAAGQQKVKSGCVLICFSRSKEDNMFKKRKKSNITICCINGDLNPIYEDLARLLIEDKTLPYACIIKSPAMDYSIGSLNILQDYLEKIDSAVHQIDSNQFFKAILRSTAYFGEVIKKNSVKGFEWYSFGNAVKEGMSMPQIRMSMETLAILRSNQIVAFPHTTVLKYMKLGREKVNLPRAAEVMAKYSQEMLMQHYG
jgi:hypothetical protein